MAAKYVSLYIDVVVTDEKALREFAEERYRKAWGDELDSENPIDVAVLEALLNSNDNPSPEKYGIASYEFSTFLSDKDQVTITGEVEVSNEKALREFAEERYQKAWGNSLSEIDPDLDLELAVKEALVLSNDNPSPDEYGIEITRCEAS